MAVGSPLVEREQSGMSQVVGEPQRLDAPKISSSLVVSTAPIFDLWLKCCPLDWPLVVSPAPKLDLNF